MSRSAGPQPAWREVRFSRRRCGVLVLLGALGSAAGFGLAFAGAPGWSAFALIVVAGLGIFAGVVLLAADIYFEYDLHSARVRAVRPWSRAFLVNASRARSVMVARDPGDEYPEFGYIRLEYASETREMFQVSPNGSRLRLWLRPGWAERSDWESFVRHLRRMGALREEP